jgi:hypothetical protein
MTRHLIVSALTAMVLVCTAQAVSKRPMALVAGRVPLFQIRARVTSSGGGSPSTKLFTYRWGKQSVKVQGRAWSPWLDFTTPDAEVALGAYSNHARRHFPVVLGLQVFPAVDPTLVNVQVRFADSKHTVDLHGDLFGPSLGIMVWRQANTGAPRVATMAVYNRRYWHEFDAASLRPSARPKHFLIADRFIGGDDDRLDWENGISHLAESGITAMIVPASAPLRSMLLKNGLRRIALGAGITGGPLGLRSDTAEVEKWSSTFASRYFKAGYKPGDFSLFALADEPGWYYPSALEVVDTNPALLETFRHYLADQHLTPAMLGANSWDEVYPVGHSKVSPSAPLSTRRLFYWTCRFFPWKAAEYMREGTTQLHRAFTLELKTYSNWNDFAGQYYYEGFRANNPDFTSPDEAMGTPDWFEFGRMHAADLLWTEDWFGNNRAYQWSFYAAKFRSIAYKNGLGFGGYVIGQTAGNPMGGMLRKILTLVGSGAKALYYYNFGPEYTFPGNCYSEVPGVVAEFAKADKMIAKAENVLWPGREPRAQVAILQPSSSEMWDGLHIPPGSRVVGAASTNLNDATLDYMAEVFDEYLALEMSDIPVDFVSENGLTDGTLNKYKVLYITEPDIPSEAQRSIAQWVKNGGTLAMVPGAAQGDRYDEPMTLLTSLSGSPWHSRAYVPNVLKLNQTETIGNIPTFGGPPAPAAIGKAISTFSDKIPAIQQDHVGKGNVIYYTYFPGLSFAHFALNARLELQQGTEADSLRRQVLTPVRTADVTSLVQVNTAYVETPVLMSSAGAAITFLNWTGHDLPSVRVTVRAPFRIARAESVTHGSIRLHHEGNHVTFSLPLGAADIVELTH